MDLDPNLLKMNLLYIPTISLTPTGIKILFPSMTHPIMRCSRPGASNPANPGIFRKSLITRQL